MIGPGGWALRAPITHRASVLLACLPQRRRKQRYETVPPPSARVFSFPIRLACFLARPENEGACAVAEFCDDVRGCFVRQHPLCFHGILLCRPAVGKAEGRTVTVCRQHLLWCCGIWLGRGGVAEQELACGARRGAKKNGDDDASPTTTYPLHNMQQPIQASSSPKLFVQ